MWALMLLMCTAVTPPLVVALSPLMYQVPTWCGTSVRPRPLQVVQVVLVIVAALVPDTAPSFITPAADADAQVSCRFFVVSVKSTAGLLAEPAAVAV